MFATHDNPLAAAGPFYHILPRLQGVGIERIRPIFGFSLFCAAHVLQHAALLALRRNPKIVSSRSILREDVWFSLHPLLGSFVAEFGGGRNADRQPFGAAWASVE